MTQAAQVDVSRPAPVPEEDSSARAVRPASRASHKSSVSASIAAYLRDVGAVPLLDAAEEAELARKIQHWRRTIGRLLAQLPACCRAAVRAGTAIAPEDWPQADRLHALEQLSTHASAQHRRRPDLLDELRHAQRQLSRARDRLILANLRLVVHVAKPYVSPRLALLDLVQEGNIGLMRAAEKFEHERGTKFSTYAHWWIKQAVQRAVAEKAEIIRVPIRVAELRKRLLDAADELGQRMGAEPSLSEIAAAAGMHENKVAEVLSVPREPLALEAPAGPTASASSALLLTVEDPANVSPVDRIQARELHGLVEGLLDTLEPREAEILRLRFGLEEPCERTLEEVGQLLQLSRERVRQIQASALRKLRAPATRRGLTHSAR